MASCAAPLPDQFIPLRQRVHALGEAKKLEAVVMKHLARCESWRWASWSMLQATLLPHTLLLDKTRKWGKPGGKPRRDWHEHGFDADGNIVLVCDPWFNGEHVGQDLTSYELVFRSGDDDLPPRTLDIISTDNAGQGRNERKIRSIRRYTLNSQGRPEHQLFLSGLSKITSKAHETRYIWADDRLVRLEEEEWEWFDKGYSSRDERTWTWVPSWALTDHSTSTQTFSYDGDGLDTVKNCTDVDMSSAAGSVGVYEKIMYRRPRPGETPNELAPKVAQAMADAIARQLERASIPDELFAVALLYAGGQCTMPVSLRVGRSAFRASTIEQEPKRAKQAIWITEEWGDGTMLPELDDSALLELCDLFNMVCEAAGKWSVVHKTIREAAEILNGRSWEGVIQTTDDFVFVPYDVDGGNSFKGDLKHSVDSDTFGLLKSRRMI